jgi:hypothetical protein
MKNATTHTALSYVSAPKLLNGFRLNLALAVCTKRCRAGFNFLPHRAKIIPTLHEIQETY